MSENPSRGVEVKGMHGGIYAADHGIPPQAVGASQVHAVHQGMHLPAQIEDVHAGSNSAGGAHMHLYVQEQEHGVHGASGGERMDEEHDGAVDGAGMEGGVPPDADPGAIGVMVAQGLGNQLTLSFQGEVYVFDSVSPEKVQAVLLLLGGRELTSGMASLPSSSQQNNRRSNFPQRVASLMRFREKRKERNFDKKIRYTVRKEVAQRMQRNKGQFTSSKSKPEDATLGVTSWDATQQWGSVENRPQAASACHHCGISAQSTPMMRRGPDGPRTLCNACGLMWANKGTLRELSRSGPVLCQNTTCEPNVMNEGNEANGDQLPAITNGHESSS